MPSAGKYRTIIADPPWTPTLNAGHPSYKAGPQRQYRTMSVRDICSLKVPAAKQAHLWLWVVSQHVDWGYEVARAWGFEPWNMLTWTKPGLGVGRFQCNSEHVLVCRRGPRHGNPSARPAERGSPGREVVTARSPRSSTGSWSRCLPARTWKCSPAPADLAGTPSATKWKDQSPYELHPRTDRRRPGLGRART